MAQSRGISTLLGRPVSRRRLLHIAGTGALGLAALPLLAACGSGGSSSGGGGGNAGAKATTIQMSTGSMYSPAKVTVAKGSTVTWVNADTTTHTATDDPSKASKKEDAVLPSGAQPWDSGNIDPGGRWSHTFDVAGDYTYFCIPHEADGMIGHITVTA
ncbi:MAG TPA: plastocyanin/azurin family copper-binding protein [Thermomicrobiales bacterium]|nr:plastocyanin/azurin family copper-binding protein [Thermomicrobiales bacterium]